MRQEEALWKGTGRTKRRPRQPGAPVEARGDGRCWVIPSPGLKQVSKASPRVWLQRGLEEWHETGESESEESRLLMVF